MITKKYSILAGLYALLLPQVMMCRSFVPPDEGGGGGGDKPEEPSPLLRTLFGLPEKNDDGTEKKPEESADSDKVERGLSLQEAIAEPSAEEKKKAEEAAAAAQKKTDDEAATKKKEEEAAAAAQKKKEEEAAAAAQPQEQPIKVVKRKSAAELAAEEAEKKKASEAAAVQEWEKGLLDEEREQLELARFAEKQDGTKYKGLAAKTEKFLRDLQAKTGATDFDPDSDEYKAWLEKERPTLSATEIRVLERARGAETAREESKKQTDAVLDQTFRMIEAPVVKREADEYYATATKEVMPEEMAKVFKEDPTKAREQFPLEYEVIERVLDTHAEDVEEMLALTRVNTATQRALKAFDEKNPQHLRILNMVNTIDADFAKTGGDALVRNGRRFLPRNQLARLPAAERAKHWTFTSKEIAARSTSIAKAEITRQLGAEHERLKRLGFEKKAPAAAAAAPAAAASTTPAAHRPATSSAPAGGGKAVTSNVEKLLIESGMRADPAATS